jgi:hypothetical protein
MSDGHLKLGGQFLGTPPIKQNQTPFHPVKNRRQCVLAVQSAIGPKAPRLPSASFENINFRHDFLWFQFGNEPVSFDQLAFKVQVLQTSNDIEKPLLLSDYEISKMDVLRCWQRVIGPDPRIVIDMRLPKGNWYQQRILLLSYDCMLFSAKARLCHVFSYC